MYSYSPEVALQHPGPLNVCTLGVTTAPWDLGELHVYTCIYIHVHVR